MALELGLHLELVLDLELDLKPGQALEQKICISLWFVSGVSVELSRVIDFPDGVCKYWIVTST